ncbi:MAG TPA: T9SS type A sorting domain-containing protein, partial [Bacteroidales bacterium]|nr:T9SS type A sorting domain-containing protein [Bacteroidales bacterium]
ANYYFTFTGTGIGNIDNQSFISIYPNPFINSITIDIGATSISEKLKCQLFNSTGKLVKEEMIEFNSGSQQTISVENFSSGLYFIKIFNNQLLVTKKLIKL